MQNLCLGTECTVSGCQSCEASILLHLTQNDVWEFFGGFRKPSTGKKMQNLSFRTEYTVSGYQSCEASILLHWTQIDVWGCSEYFANLRQVTSCKTCVPSLNALFRGTKFVKHLHWTQNDVWYCFVVFH
jgi:hypothetical protein